MTLDGVEFLRRFLMHVLPRGFHKVHYYGLWHPGKRNMQIAAKLLLILTPPARKKIFLLTTDHPIRENTETPAPEKIKTFGRCCPQCGCERLTLLLEIPRGRNRRRSWSGCYAGGTVARGDPKPFITSH
jgi:hypothetical protein